MNDETLPLSDHNQTLSQNQNVHDFSTSNTTILGLGPQRAGTGVGVGEMSQLEQEVLDEYVRLDGNMKKLSATLTSLTTPAPLASTGTAASAPLTLEIAEGLRLLERKVASVYTLVKASVYSIVLQQGETEGETETEIRGDGTGEGL